jgi:glycosyltransferase involved in cell wall biosynthesis
MPDHLIYLAVCGKFHAFALAREFAEMGRLGGLFAADHHFQPPAGVPGSAYFNRWDIKYWRVLARRLPFGCGHSFRREHVAFDRWLLKKLERLPGGIFHGWNSHVSTTLPRLDPARWLRCVERSCPHNQFQHDLLGEESQRLDIPYSADPEDLERSIQELYDADVIVAPSTYSARSYSDPALATKVRVNPLGANYACQPKLRDRSAAVRILLVGNAFLRKGTHYLIEAFSKWKNPSAELWIRGEVPATYRSRIRDSRIKIIPPVSSQALHELYATATMFCLPSIDEGFGMVALEALSFGLPLVYTDHCGVGDLLNESIGRKVPIRSASAILDAIDTIQNWTPKDYVRFDQERAKVLQKCSWRNTALRMIEQIYVNAK